MMTVEETFFNLKIKLATPDGKPIDIPIGGSIGLLALGDIGTIAWRQKNHEAKIELAQRSKENLSKKKNKI